LRLCRRAHDERLFIATTGEGITITAKAPNDSAKPSQPIDDKADRAAAAAFDGEQKRRARQALREEAAQKKEQERRDRATVAGLPGHRNFAFDTTLLGRI